MARYEISNCVEYETPSGESFTSTVRHYGDDVYRIVSRFVTLYEVVEGRAMAIEEYTMGFNLTGLVRHLVSQGHTVDVYTDEGECLTWTPLN
jgi:hypothetical protein